jgi:hypothetical protein
MIQCGHSVICEHVGWTKGRVEATLPKMSSGADMPGDEVLETALRRSLWKWGRYRLRATPFDHEGSGLLPRRLRVGTTLSRSTGADPLHHNKTWNESVLKAAPIWESGSWCRGNQVSATAHGNTEPACRGIRSSIPAADLSWGPTCPGSSGTSPRAGPGSWPGHCA